MNKNHYACIWLSGLLFVLEVIFAIANLDEVVEHWRDATVALGAPWILICVCFAAANGRVTHLRTRVVSVFGSLALFAFFILAVLSWMTWVIYR